MFTSITVRNFRCFRHLEVAPLARINLVAGANNVGKTAFLEAFFLLLGLRNISLVMKLNAFRGIGEVKGDPLSIRELMWNPLFAELNEQARIEITGTTETHQTHKIELEIVPPTSQEISVNNGAVSGADWGFAPQVLRLRYTGPQEEVFETRMLVDEKGIRVEPIPPTPPFPGFFLAARHRRTPQEDAEQFGRLEVSQEPEVVEMIVDALRIVEPRLKRLTTIYSGGLPLLWGDLGMRKLLPVVHMGDGLGRLLSLLLTIASAPNGVVLVDEVENGLHHSILPKIWQAVGQTARTFNTQIVATTHSFECIQAAHMAFEQSEHYDFRLHRLERIGEDIHAVTYDSEALSAAILANLEVR